MSDCQLKNASPTSDYFRTVADYTYDWESWHDPQGKVLWVNPSVVRLTGYSVEQCLLMSDYPLPIVASEDRPRIRQMLADAIDKKSFNDLEFRIKSLRGDVRWMAVSWQPMFDDAGAHLGFRTSVRDVTERQLLREQLKVHADQLEQLIQVRTERIAQLETHRRQMEKLAAMGELAAGVAHEINNPLAGIRNAFTLIKASMEPSHEHFELLELVDTEIERVSSIVHQMYQLYKRPPAKPTELVLEKVIHDVVCLLEPIARRYQVSLEVEPLLQAVHVRLPEGELKQILFNLIRNAIQASTAGQVVSVRLELCIESYSSNAAKVKLEVIDHGSGIADSILPHIFEPFFTTKGQLREGMGLGLSVTRNLIESFGGSIDVDTQLGHGTKFTVKLPRAIPY